ncbi:protein of unknown function [Agreia sp. COWG]|nr:protein of unknown function [Agreia sp. COWG]CAD6003029.1 protein of unknown function [Agreia sp. COWG]
MKYVLCTLLGPEGPGLLLLHFFREVWVWLDCLLDPGLIHMECPFLGVCGWGRIPPVL